MHRPHESSATPDSPVQTPREECHHTVTSVLRLVHAWTRGEVRNLSVTLSECGQQVRLHGSAPSYFIKQMAQEGARRHAPSLQVQNLIDVAEAA
ncbi:MAG: hypothetical protein PHI23_04230 [Candidatus Peribacteraceae bacterium]|nr:hypothetical protein [Candidatus Peribacteraceae bacterium]